MDEFGVIERFFRHAPQADSVLLGPGDDAAVIKPTSGMGLAMSMDTLLEGRHSPVGFPAEYVGWRSLAVNLSDLAAMGARPRWALLSLSLPYVDEDWLEGFCRGFFALAEQMGVSLIGGDTVKGPLSITVQVTGEVPATRALRRSGARPGDKLCITGPVGLAAAGLANWQAGITSGALVQAFAQPMPQCQTSLRLQGLATSAIDISDGLLADLQHVLTASGAIGADVHVEALPLTPAFLSWGDAAQRQQAQLYGGDDYQLLFTLLSHVNVPRGCVQIGRITSRPRIRVQDFQGQWHDNMAIRGWDHFTS